MMSMIFCENILLLDAGFSFLQTVPGPYSLVLQLFFGKLHQLFVPSPSDHRNAFLADNPVCWFLPRVGPRQTNLFPVLPQQRNTSQNMRLWFSSFFFWNVGKRESKICRETLWQTCLIWENPTIFQFQIPEIDLKNTSETNYKSLCGCSKKPAEFIKG